MSWVRDAFPTLNERCVWLRDSERRTYLYFGNIRECCNDSRSIELTGEPRGNIRGFPVANSQFVLPLRESALGERFATLGELPAGSKVRSSDRTRARRTIALSRTNLFPAPPADMLWAWRFDTWKRRLALCLVSKPVLSSWLLIGPRNTFFKKRCLRERAPRALCRLRPPQGRSARAAQPLARHPPRPRVAAPTPRPARPARALDLRPFTR
jgi:hypothetical protein